MSKPKGIFKFLKKLETSESDEGRYQAVLSEIEANPNQKLSGIQRKLGLDGATHFHYLQMLGQHRAKAFRSLIRERKQDFSLSHQDIDFLIVRGPKGIQGAAQKKTAQGLVKLAREAGFKKVDVFQPDNPSLLSGSLELKSIIKKRRERGRQLFICSFSFGSAYFRYALDQGNREFFNHILGWLNLSGMVYGSPRFQLDKKKHWYLAKRSEFLRSFSCENKYFARPVADHIPCTVSFLSSRLSGSMTSGEKKHYHGLRHWGPNDGWICFNDYETMPGFVIPLWGQKHFLNPGRESVILQKTIGYLVELSQLHGARDWSLKDLDFVIPKKKIDSSKPGTQLDV